MPRYAMGTVVIPGYNCGQITLYADVVRNDFVLMFGCVVSLSGSPALSFNLRVDQGPSASQEPPGTERREYWHILAYEMAYRGQKRVYIA